MTEIPIQISPSPRSQEAKRRSQREQPAASEAVAPLLKAALPLLVVLGLVWWLLPAASSPAAVADTPAHPLEGVAPEALAKSDLDARLRPAQFVARIEAPDTDVIKDIHQQGEELAKSKAALQQQLKDRNTQLAAARQQQKLKQGQLDQTRASLQALANPATLKADIAALQNRLDADKQQLADAERKRTDLQSRLADAEREYNAAKSRYDQLDATAGSINQEGTRLNQLKAQRERDLNGLLFFPEANAAIIPNVQREIIQLRRQVDQLGAQFNQLKQQSLNEKRAMSSADSRGTQINGEISLMDQQIAQLKTAILQTGQQIRSLEDSRDSATSKKGDLERDAQKLEQEVTRLDGEIVDHQKRVAEVESKLKEFPQ